MLCANPSPDMHTLPATITTVCSSNKEHAPNHTSELLSTRHAKWNIVLVATNSNQVHSLVIVRLLYLPMCYSFVCGDTMRR